MGAHVGSPLGYSTNMLLGLIPENYLGTWEGSLVGVSLGTLSSLMVGNVEGSFVGFSLGLPIRSQLEYSNHGAELTEILLGTLLGLCFGSEAVSCLCLCFRLRYYRKAICWGVGISCVLLYGAIITSNTKSGRYLQPLDLLTLVLSHTWSIPSFIGSWRAAELASSGFITFTLGTDKDWSILTA